MKRIHNKIDELFMMECLTLAEKGGGYASPNPMVGAVLVKNNKVIARGYHKKFGGPHAEVNAIRSSKISVRGATLYVNLEPCNLFGKTPPCTDLLVSSGISRVVVGMLDPNPLVVGKGIRLLRKAGITVDVGILQNECRKLNESFIKYITTGLPFVTLKIAQTLDGKIADVVGDSKWITNSKSRTLVHYLRSRYDAVLVGVGTVNKDNPRLTVRNVKGRNPVRVVLDGTFRIDPHASICSRGEKTILFTSRNSAANKSSKKEKLITNGVEVIEVDSKKDGIFSIKNVLRILGLKGIASVLVEGGATTYCSFLNEKIVDKMFVFIAPKIFGGGINSFSALGKQSLKNEFQLSNVSSWNIENDLLIETYMKSNQQVRH